MTALASCDASALLRCLHRLTDSEDLASFPDRVLEAVADLVPADVIGFNTIDPASGRTTVTLRPEMPWIDIPEFERLAPQHPVIAHAARTGDGSARMISDFLSRRQFRRLEIYQDFFQHMGAEHQISISVIAGPALVIGLAMNRQGRDFSERDRTLLNLIRPTLVSTHQLLETRARMQAVSDAVQLDGSTEDGIPVATGRLTGREVEVLAAAARGMTNKQIAEVLQLSPRTVQKHLEHIYEKLQTGNRAGAVTRFARAWQALPAQSDQTTGSRLTT